MGTQIDIPGHTGHAANPLVTCRGEGRGVSLTAAAACPAKSLAAAPPAQSPSRPVPPPRPGACGGAGTGTDEVAAAQQSCQGQPEAPAAPWDSPGLAPSAAVRARCWAEGMHQGCLQRGSHSALKPSPPSTHTVPSSPQTLLQPLRTLHSGSMALQRPLCTAGPQPPSPPCPPQLHLTLGWLRPPDFTHNTDPASLCVPGVLPFHCTGHQVP